MRRKSQTTQTKISNNIKCKIRDKDNFATKQCMLRVKKIKQLKRVIRDKADVKPVGTNSQVLQKNGLRWLTSDHSPAKAAKLQSIQLEKLKKCETQRLLKLPMVFIVLNPFF